MKWLLITVLLGSCVFPTRGVVLLGSSDSNRNSSPPTGELSGSGWELQGKWGAFLGTPIAPRYFISAKHIGGSVGDEFHLNGVVFRTTAVFDDPESDLRIWRVDGTFPTFAAINSGNDEVGKRIAVFGRGGPKGAAVELQGLFGREQKGWVWTGSDGVLRWGENTVSAVVSAGGGGFLPLTGASPGTGELLKMEFNFNGGENEAHLSVGDSGGAVFLQGNGTWKLAGINLAVDGPYNTTPSGPGFGASIFDEGGLYKGGEGRWQSTPDLPTEQAGSFYATRISSRAEWIEGVLQQVIPEPILEISASVPGGFLVDSNAQVDTNSKVVRTSVRPGSNFFRLRFERQLRIRSVELQGANLLMHYEETR